MQKQLPKYTSLLSNDRVQTTLFEFALTALVVRRLGGLRSRNKEGEVVSRTEGLCGLTGYFF